MRRNIMTVSFAALCLATPRAAQTGVRPVTGPAARDLALKGEVRVALARELGPAGDDLTVEVRNGVVTLGGQVADASIRQRAERTAAGVPGVSRVSAAAVALGMSAAAPTDENQGPHETGGSTQPA